MSEGDVRGSETEYVLPNIPLVGTKLRVEKASFDDISALGFTKQKQSLTHLHFP